MFRIRIGELDIESTNKNEFEWLLKQVPRVKKLAGKFGVSKPIRAGTPTLANAAAIIPFKTEGRIRRTNDERKRGLTLEQALEERRQKAAKLGIELPPQVLKPEDQGERFEGDLDLDELPVVLDDGENESESGEETLPEE